MNALTPSLRWNAVAVYFGVIFTLPFLPLSLLSLTFLLVLSHSVSVQRKAASKPTRESGSAACFPSGQNRTSGVFRTTIKHLVAANVCNIGSVKSEN